MSFVADVVGLSILFVFIVLFGRAGVGLFIWKGRRKYAIVQLLALPVIAFIALAAVIPRPDDAEVTSETGTATGLVAANTQEPEMPAAAPTPSGAPLLEASSDHAAQDLGALEAARDRTAAMLAEEQAALETTRAQAAQAIQELAEIETTRDQTAAMLAEEQAALTDLRARSAELAEELAEIEAATDEVAAEAETTEETAEAESSEENEECRASLTCWAEEHFLAASFACAPLVERLAQFTMEWTDRWYETKFSHFRWSARGNGVVTYIGDRARFQTGFGAWQDHIYECDYDPIGEVVLNVRARQGRLD